MPHVYYNEIDAAAAAWLRELIRVGVIAPGDVDTRSIAEVMPDDLRGYTQHHFFAGIGGWSAALRHANWPDDRAVWTGSCPCQPFSGAGRPPAMLGCASRAVTTAAPTRTSNREGVGPRATQSASSARPQTCMLSRRMAALSQRGEVLRASEPINRQKHAAHFRGRMALSTRARGGSGGSAARRRQAKRAGARNRRSALLRVSGLSLDVRNRLDERTQVS